MRLDAFGCWIWVGLAKFGWVWRSLTKFGWICLGLDAFGSVWLLDLGGFG